MVLTSCWRCSRTYSGVLLRYQVRTSPAFPTFVPPSMSKRVSGIIEHKSTFTITAPQYNPAPAQKKATALAQSKQKGGTTLKIKKKKAPVKTGKPGTEGERKQRRKNLVLSNAGANNVPLPVLTADIATNLNAPGSLFGFEGPKVTILKLLGAFHLKQGWELFYNPTTLVREESVEIGRLIGWVNGEPERQELPGANTGHKSTSGPDMADEWLNKSPWRSHALQSRSGRRVIHGIKGSGKSVILLQAMCWATQRDWVVITIPEAQELTIGHTEYEHDLTTNLWIQKQYTSELLARILGANHSVLQQVPLSRDYTFAREEVKKSQSLAKLVELGASDSIISWDVFTTLLKELSFPGRPPVLFTLDNLNQISLPTNYRSPEYKRIHAHDLALSAIFLDYLSGKRSFWRGVTLAATSSMSPRTDSLDYALRGETPPAYEKIDPRIAPSLEGAPVMNLSPLTRKEAKALMEYYRDSGIYKENVDETLPEKFALSSGNPKELLASCKRLKY